MIQEYPLEKRTTILPHFGDHTKLDLIIKAFITEGWGKIFVDSIEDPKVLLFQHDFFNFLSGNPNNENLEELLSHIPRHKIIILPNEEWAKALKKHFRFKFVKKKNSRWKLSSTDLDLAYISKLEGKFLKGFTLEKIDENNAELFTGELKGEIFDLFDSKELFLKKGFGYCLRDGNTIACAAATGHPPFENAFEIQVITDRKYRKKGLATVACAALIKYSLENGFKPHWDAANKPSVNLALKLGYTNPVPYGYYFHAILPVILLRKTRINRLIYYTLKLFGKV
ncbi:MAG: GNAT family N-acetyltransferase [Candidatus Hodarchaeales archaeon]